jgi:tellurite resistance protein
MPLSPLDPFSERRKNLEEQFFKDRDQHLMEKMRSELNAFEEKKQLAHVSGIVEERVLDNLAKAGVKAETLAAVSLVPLVEVAWADGSISPEERDAVLNAAVAQGIHADSAPYAILESWLQTRPDPKVMVAWRDYVQEVSRLMPKDSVAELKRAMLDRATRVAEAAGGFLGLATISKSEKAVIDGLAKAFG